MAMTLNKKLVLRMPDSPKKQIKIIKFLSDTLFEFHQFYWVKCFIGVVNMQIIYAIF
jgi:hypothetical protein